MESAWDWETGEGLLGLDDPAAWDAAFERGENHLGTAAIGLAFTCSLEEASPRIVRAARLPDRGQRGFAFTAVRDKLEGWWLRSEDAVGDAWRAARRRCS